MASFKSWLIENKLFIWDHTGTKFTDIDGEKATFKGKSGETFVIDIDSNKGPGGWSYGVTVQNKDNKLIGSVRFSENGEVFKGPKRTYSTNQVHVDEKYRREGIARAMYDYFTQLVGAIYRHDYQTSDGRKFWDNNPSKHKSLPEKDQIKKAQDDIFSFMPAHYR